MPIGAGAFALICTLLGHRSGVATWIVFAVDAATFVVSFAMIRQLRGDGREATQEEDAEAGVSFRQAWRLEQVRAIAPPTAAVALGLGGLGGDQTTSTTQGRLGVRLRRTSAVTSATPRRAARAT